MENNSAGIVVKFLTDSKTVELSYTAFSDVKCKAGYGACLTKGIVFRISNIQDKVIKRGVCLNKDLTIEQKTLVNNQNTIQMLCYELVLPNIAIIDQIYIFIDDEADIFPATAKSNKIAFFGGANTLGAGCTFQNTTMPFIVADSIGAELFNFATNSYNFYSDKHAQLIDKEQPDYIVCELFSATTRLDYMKTSVGNYVESIIKASKNALVIFWSYPLISPSLELKDKHSLFKELKREYSHTSGHGPIFVCCDELFKHINFDEYTTSPYFINDKANYILANRLIQIIKDLG